IQNTLVAKDSVKLTTTPGDTLVYEDNPLYGLMFHKEVGSSYAMMGQEVTLSAFPIFFSLTNRLSNDVNYRWSANTGDPQSGSSVTYRIQDGAPGSSRIYLESSHASKYSQSSRKNFLIEFNK